MELDFTNEIVAGRPGPKSSAQTPAKPEEKKKGSSKNEPGSAGTSPDSKQKSKKILKRQDEKDLVKEAKGKITFSEKVTTSLKNKVKEHNEKHSRKVTLGMLKKVYRRGLGAFSSSHRPGQSRAAWAMARVNMFLKMMRGGKVKESYRKADQDVARASEEELPFIELQAETWSPGDFQENKDISKIEFALAKIDLLSIGSTVSEILEEEGISIFDIDSAEAKTLNKPFRLPKGSKKKFGVYVKNDKGNVVKVTFGDPNMEIKRDDPERRKSFRARHKCDTNPGPKYKARYWSCKQWRAGKKVEAELSSDASLLDIYPQLSEAQVIEEEGY